MVRFILKIIIESWLTNIDAIEMVIVSTDRFAIAARHAESIHVVGKIVQMLVIAYTSHVGKISSNGLNLIHKSISHSSVILYAYLKIYINELHH